MNLVALPDDWAFSPVPPNARWEALGRLARIDAHLESELALLMHEAGLWDVGQQGPQDTPVLVQVLSGWGRMNNRDQHAKPPLAQLPLAGEPPWDGTGNVAPWTLPAALLVSRGADPFATDEKGTSGFSLALSMGAVALVQQMLRLPHAPHVDQWPHLELYRPSSMPTVPIFLPALHTVATQGSTGLLRVLLNASASADARDGTGATPLMQASLRNVGLLLEAGADPLAADLVGLVCLEHWAIHESQAVLGGTRQERKDFWKSILRNLADPAQRARSLAAALFFGNADLVQAIPGKPRRGQWARLPGPFGLNLVEWGLVGSLLRPSGQRCLVDTLDRTEWPPETLALAQAVRLLRKQGHHDPQPDPQSVLALHRLARVWAAARLPLESWTALLQGLFQRAAWVPHAVPLAIDACSQKIMPALHKRRREAQDSDWAHLPYHEVGEKIEAIGYQLRTLEPASIPALQVPRMQLWGRALAQPNCVTRHNMRPSQPIAPLPEGWLESQEADHLSQEWPLLRAVLVGLPTEKNANKDALAVGDAACMAITIPEAVSSYEPRRHRM